MLFIGKNVAIPYDLLGVGFKLLEKWDIAAPVYGEHVLAQSLGTTIERQETEKAILDLRVPVYAHELLFVRKSADGEAFLTRWRSECEGGKDERLAFLRALHAVKPLFCVLPRAWAAKSTPPVLRIVKREPTPATMSNRRVQLTPFPMVRVEISPGGRCVRCRPGEEEQVKRDFALKSLSRQQRRELLNASNK
jgi:hypothetical protein